MTHGIGLPAWSDAFAPESLGTSVSLPLPSPVCDWAWGDATGAGVKIAIVDSGVDATSPGVAGVDGAVRFELDADAPEGYRAIEGPHDDLVGHGTACAGIIRSLAPDIELYSVRVLGSNLKGKGALFHAGMEWAVAAGMDVLNLSLSSSSDQWFGPLHELCDEAYFRNIVVVCAANNVPGPTYPSQFSSVVSVAAKEGDDPWSISYNPHPPVEFGARGIDVEVHWVGGSTIVATGNSFAAPHVAALAALVLEKHPGMTPFQVKSVLQAVADNAV